MEFLDGLPKKAIDLGRRFFRPKHPTAPTHPIVNSEPPRPAEIFHYPDISWTVIDMPSKTGSQDYHTTGTRTIDDGNRYEVAVVADAISSPKEAGSILAHSRKYSNDLAEKLLSGTPLSEIEDTDKEKLKSFALTATRITYPREQKGDYQMEVATHRDCFTAVLIPIKQDGLEFYKFKVFPLTKQGLKAAPAESLPPGTIIFSGSDGSYNHLTDYVISLYREELAKKNLEPKYRQLYESSLEKLQKNQQKFGWDDSAEGLRQDEFCIQETLVYLDIIHNLTFGQEDSFISDVKAGIEASIQKNGGSPNDDLTLLMTYLPKAQKEGTSKEDKPRSLDELRNEVVGEIEVLLKDDERSPTIDGSAITGYNRSGNSSLQCRHVWYGRDTRLMDIGKGEEAMVEGVTINLDSMYNSHNSEFINIDVSEPPSEQRTYFIPIDPKCPAIVEHPTFIQRESDRMPEKEIRRVLPDDYVDKELDSPVPYRRATEQDIRDAYAIYSETIRMANSAMHPDAEEK